MSEYMKKQINPTIPIGFLRHRFPFRPKYFQIISIAALKHSIIQRMCITQYWDAFNDAFAEIIIITKRKELYVLKSS